MMASCGPQCRSAVKTKLIITGQSFRLKCEWGYSNPSMSRRYNVQSMGLEKGWQRRLSSLVSPVSGAVSKYPRASEEAWEMMSRVGERQICLAMWINRRVMETGAT